MREWLGNLWFAVVTVVKAAWVTLRQWVTTYRPSRGPFTRAYEFPERPPALSPRFRGFHRYDLTSCIACGRCARDCPVGCIYIDRERVPGRKGFRIKTFVIDYTRCMFCGFCTENCPADCIFMGQTYDLSCFSRDGCVVDFAKLPLEIAWGYGRLNPSAVLLSKYVTEPVHEGPQQ